MPYTIAWHVERRVSYMQMLGEVTPEELKAAIAEHREKYTAGCTPPLHVITDLTDMTKYPMSVNQFWDTIRTTPDPEVGFSIVVSPNAMARFVGSVLSRLVRVETRSFATLDEALEFLQKQDPTLPDLRMAPPIPYVSVK